MRLETKKMRLKQKILRAYYAAVLTFVPLVGVVAPASAEPGNFFMTFDAPSVAPGQNDVPVYIQLDSNGTDVSFAGCELDVNASQAAFSHGSQNHSSFTTDFSGPNGDFDSGGGANQRLFYGNSSPAVTASSNMEVYVLFYDVSASASGTINLSFDTADTGNCLISDASSSPFTTISGTSNSLDVSGVTVAESSSSTDVTEGGASDSFDVVLDAEPASNVTIDITDDAQANVDMSSLTFTNANWDTPQTITVTAEDDGTIEGSHSGTISMEVNGSSDPLYTGLTLGDVSVNVMDNDGLLVEYTATSNSSNEGDSGSASTTFELTVSGGDTSGGSAESIDVDVTGGTATGGGDDYTFTDPTTVTIPAADYTTPQTISVPSFTIEGDTAVESDETILFGLTGASSGVAVGDADGADGTESTATYTINNDDGLLVELSTTSASDVENTGGNVPTLLVSGADTSGGSAETVDVNILGSSTADGSDYSSGGATITIPAADYSSGTTPIAIGLTITGDTTVEADDTIDLSLGSPSAGVSIGDADGANGIENTHTYTITNDDQLTAELTSTTASDTETSGGNIPQILVNGTSDVATTIRVDDDGTGSAASGSDYSLTDPVDIAVPAATYDGTTGTAVSVPLTITSDAVFESNETVDFTLSAPAGNITLADVDAADGVESTHTYTITDDDQLSVEFDIATDNADEDAGYTPTLRFGGAILTSPQTIEVTTTGGSATGGGDDYTYTSPTTITIPVGDYSSGTTTASVTGFSVASDGLVESDETVVFGLQNPSSGTVIADADGAGGTENVLTFTITNDDGLIVEFTNTSASDNENAGGSLPQVVVSGADTTGGSAESVDVTVTGGTATGGSDDYTFTDPETVNIPAGDYTTPQIISLSGLSIDGDTTIEPNETIIFGLASLSANLALGNADGDASTESAHTYTINNDDGLLVELSTTSASDVENTGGNVPTLLVSGADTSGGSAETVDVNILGSSTADGSDYSSGGATITIPAADYSSGTTPIAIGLTVTGDTTVEADDTIDLSLGSPSAGISIGDADGASGIENTHTYTITNDDSLSVEFDVTSASDNEATGGNAPVVLVSGVSDIAASVTVDDASTGSATISTDYAFTDPSIINIPAGTYDGTSGTAVAIGLSVNDDVVVEPNETIVFNLSATSYAALADVDGTDGVESTHTYTITNDDTTASDSDNDGINDSVEDAGPNGGDANGDGTPDSAQTSVTSLVNALTGEYNVLELATGCSVIDSYDIATEASQAAQDDTYDYPQGLHDFSLTCGSAGESGTVTFILDRDYDVSGWEVRKLNRNSASYKGLATASFATRNIGGSNRTTISYSITDGGEDDEDGIANGVIVDPVGIATAGAAVDNTLESTGQSAFAAMLTGTALVGFSFVAYRTTRTYIRYTIRK